MGWMQNENGLKNNNANYVPLTPLSHINRAAQVFPNKDAVIYGEHRKTWLETRNRCSKSMKTNRAKSRKTRETHENTKKTMKSRYLLG